MGLLESMQGKFTYEELRREVDEKLYGITDDPLVPYPWDRDFQIEIHSQLAPDPNKSSSQTSKPQEDS